jgi:hypothetical protein
VLSENLKWDVAIVGNEIAMVNYVKLKLYILLQVSKELNSLLKTSAVRRRQENLAFV